MTLNTNLDAQIGVKMLEKVLEAEMNQLPTHKKITDFGGGYVECLKTKAKLVLYFGFDENRNRCQIIIDIDKADVLLWTQAIAEKIWNKEKTRNKYTFGSDENSIQKEEIIINKDGVRKPII